MAGIYGMNFKFMPELNWVWGYPFGLAIIILSALVPVIRLSAERVRYDVDGGRSFRTCVDRIGRSGVTGSGI